ncbi:MAG: hypothetical protein WBI06_14635 [Paludibacter sp.]
MKTKFFYIYSLFAFFILGYSCTSEDKILESSIDGEILSETSDIAINSPSMEDLILPIEGDRDTLKRPLLQRSMLFDDISEEIDQLNEIPIYLKVQGNSTSKQFLNATNKGVELTVANYLGNTNQQFYIKILPATSGIPYLIYSKQTNTPIRVGTYTSNPNVKVLYASQDASGTLFGASWDFKKGEYTSNSFVIANQDYPEQGSSGSWWDIYYNVITVNDAKITFAKYNKSPRQEFQIMPVETFVIEEVKFNVDASSVLTRLPDILLKDSYSNNEPIEQTHKFTFTETVQETSNFNRKTSYNVTIASEIKAKVPFVASEQITTSASFGQEYTYGKSETTTRVISREYPIIVPAYHKAEISLSLFQYNMDVEYVACCRGLTSGKLINIKGRWTGVDVVESDAVLNVNPLQGGTGIQMIITNEMLKTNTPIKVK